MKRFEKRFLMEAIRLAGKNIQDGHGGPFGAVIVKNGKIIASGCNHVTTAMDPTAHAEIVAIRNACKKLNDFQLTGCELYSSCEPCPMCLGAIYWARPDRFYFAASKKDAANAGFDDSLIYEEIGLPPSERRIPGIQKPQEEALKVFKIWNQLEKKTEY